ncbi:MAG: hypothetical protein LW816_13625 [Planctomyces sp.]|nr:hypothetical protein [Planctomyces sp.]
MSHPRLHPDARPAIALTIAVRDSPEIQLALQRCINLPDAALEAAAASGGVTPPVPRRAQRTVAAALKSGRSIPVCQSELRR